MENKLRPNKGLKCMFEKIGDWLRPPPSLS